MAVQVRLARVTAGGTTPQAIAATGFTDGDTILLEVRNQNASVVVTVPAGFTLLYSVTGSVQEVRVYKKIASGESGNYSVSWTGGGTARLGIVALYSDAGKGLQLDGHATQDNTSSSTNLPCPSITTTIAGAVRVDFLGINNAVTTAAGAGQTKQYDTGGTSTVAAFTETIASPGATGTRTPTGGSAQTSRVVTVAYAEMPAPSNLVATAISASEIDLTWTDNSLEDNFSLERSLTGTGGWSVINSPAANATSYNNTGLSTNTSYFYRIRAAGGGGFSAYSSIAHALTLLPAEAMSQPRLFLLQPEVVFAARVNLPDPADYPVSFVAFDTVTTGAYTDVHDGMTLLLGSSAGADDYGRQRVRGEPTAISIFVGRSSRGISDGELTLVDNAYITVWNDRRVWAKIPYIDSSSEIFKDSTLEVGDRTTNPPPVANCGEGYAATLNDDGVIIVYLPGLLSFAVADGATITDYLWDIADGSLMVGSALTDSFIYVTFPAGFRYVSLTVTDSNGNTHTAYVPIFADDPDARTSFDGFTITNHRITDAGQTMTIGILEDAPRTTYPDGTLALIWDREPFGAANRDHMLIVGWLDTEESEHNAGRTGLLRDTTLTILDVAARLDALPGFPQSLADDATRNTTTIPAITWNYMPTPTMDKYMHYLLYWHSTALEVANFVWSDTGTAYQIAIKTSDGESLWQQVKRVAMAMCPGYVLTCDRAGGLAVFPDPFFQEEDDRTDTVQTPIREENYTDLRVTYQRSPRIHWLRTGALVVQSSISFNSDGTVHLPTVFSIAPGATPGQGLGETDNNEQLAADQSTLNNATGHRYARMNALISALTLTLIQDDSAAVSAVPWREIESAYKEWVTLDLDSAYAAQRGLTFATVRCLPKEINIRYDSGRTGLTRTLELTLEPETVGVPAETVTKPDVPAPGDEPSIIPDPIPPPDMGLITGQDTVAGIGKFKVYRTTNFDNPSGSGGPTWDAKDLTGADEMLTWVVDPFSPGYIDGAGTVDGWAATTTKIYRLADLFGTTPTATAVVTFANTASWRTIQASFGTYFVEGDNPWLLCISYYGSLGGHTGTWATHSIDGGATWTDEVQVSAFYDSGGAVNPIGVYTSPKTPGLAYTCAHVATANPATSGGYVSTDYGETWGAMTSDTPTTPLPLFGQFNDAMAWTEDGYAPSDVATCSVTGTPGIQTIDTWLGFAAPADAKQVKLSGTVTALSHKGGFGSAGYSFTPSSSGLTRTVVSDSSSGGGYDVLFTRTFEYTYDFAGYLSGDWPHNSNLVHATPPTALSDLSIYFHLQCVANGTGNNASMTATITAIEITLDDGSSYIPAAGVLQPLHGQAGSLHLPWEDNDAEDVIYYGALSRSGNRLFDLKRVIGTTVTSISPNDGTRDYGVHRYGFSVRAFDSDRQFVVAAVTGNDTTSSSANDKQGVYISSNAGTTWTNIVAPTTSTEAYEAAFGGDSEQILYVWGPASYIKYSSNFGASLDDRSGNLSALSATHMIGIAGGPTG